MVSQDKSACKSFSMWAKAYPPAVGGVESYSFELACSLNEIGVLGSIYAWHSAGLGVPTTSFPKVSMVAIKTNGSDAQSFLSGILKARKIPNNQIVIATTWKAAVPAFVLGKQYVVVTHGRELYADGFKRILAKFVYKRAKSIICVSEFTKSRLVDFYSLKDRNVFACWNGGTRAKFPNLSDGTANKWDKGKDSEVIFYTICRHDERKNVLHAIRLFALLRKKLIDEHRYSSINYYIAGSGATISAELTLVEELGLEDQVHHLGRITDADVVDLHSRGHIFLHPQIVIKSGRDFEGFGLVVADAMLAGSLVIAGNNGGTSELIKHGDTGLYVEGKDVAADLEAIIPAMSSWKEMHQIATRAQIFALANFNWKVLAERIEKFL